MGGLGARVAWFGREYFAGALPALGFRLSLHSYHEPRVFTWEDVTRLCGGQPDVLVLGDRSHPPPFLGLERYPCLTVFYSVDSHIHSWHPLYAQAFDACLAGLKDDMPRFAKGRLGGERVLWSPAFALDETDMPPAPADPVWDVLFAGTVDPATTPGRAAFLARLAAKLPGLEVRQGHFLELFPRGRVILNVAERGDLNFRVFEALAMGLPLLTPRTGNGLLDIFEDGAELLAYEPDDEDDCAQKALRLLAHPEEAARMGRTGKAKVDAGHRAAHRAKAFAGFLERMMAVSTGERLAAAAEIRRTVLNPLHLHWAEVADDPALKRAYLMEARRK